MPRNLVENMSGNAEIEPPIWYWITCWILSICSFFAIVMFMQLMTVSPYDLNLKDREFSLTKGFAEFVHYSPLWVGLLFGLGLSLSLFGGVCMLFRSGWALIFFGASLMIVVVTQLPSLLDRTVSNILHSFQIHFVIFVFLFSIFELWFIKFSKNKLWIIEKINHEYLDASPIEEGNIQD